MSTALLPAAPNLRFTTTLLDADLEALPASPFSYSLRGGVAFTRENAAILAVSALEERGFASVYRQYARHTVMAKRPSTIVPAFVDVECATFAPNSNQVESVESFTFALDAYAGGIYALLRVT
jgi:hypothetical protein